MRKITFPIRNIFVFCVFALASLVTAQETVQESESEEVAVQEDTQDDVDQTVRQWDQRYYNYQYAVKFICFNADSHFRADTEQGLLSGWYMTDVNIHNPNARGTRLRKKLALAYPPGKQRPGPISRFATQDLRSDQAIEINCWDQFAYQGNATQYHYPENGIKGFLVIESDGPLDVVGVYTIGSSGSDNGAAQVQDIDVERVPATPIKNRK